MEKTFRYCDRCSKEIEYTERYFFEHIHYVKFCNKWKNNWSKDYDLCEDCVKDLKKWLEMKN